MCANIFIIKFCSLHVCKAFMLSLLILAPIALVSHNIKPGSTVTSHPSVKDKLVEGKFLCALITHIFVTVVKFLKNYIHEKKYFKKEKCMYRYFIEIFPPFFHYDCTVELFHKYLIY